MREHLFVCGTLLPTHVPGEIAHVVARLRSVGAATVAGRLYDFGDYPGAIPDASARAQIRGHVYELPPDGAALDALDEYEGYSPADPRGGLFARVRVTAALADGRALPCWMYAYNRDPGDAPLIPGGSYAEWKAAQAKTELTRQ